VVIINPSYTGTDSVLVIYLPLTSPIKPFHFVTMAITDGFIYKDSEADTADSTFEVIAEKQDSILLIPILQEFECQEIMMRILSAM